MRPGRVERATRGLRDVSVIIFLFIFGSNKKMVREMDKRKIREKLDRFLADISWRY
jgi:hypothetical protein